MKLEFDSAASREIEKTATYYREIDPDLAIRFRNEVRRLLKLTLNNPLIFRERSFRFRRANLKKFPYYFAYVIRDDALYIVTLAHKSREPEYWLDRL